MKSIIRFLLNRLPCYCICHGCGWFGPNRGLTKEGRRAAMRDLRKHVCHCVPDLEV
jgi:hypothetical protein